MKKRLIALALVIVLCFSLAGCGTDYKKLGYDYMKQSMAEEYPNGLDDATKSSIAMGVALFGYDNLYALTCASVDQLTKDDLSEALKEKDISDEDFVLFKEGCKEYIKDFFAEALGTN